MATPSQSAPRSNGMHKARVALGVVIALLFLLALFMNYRSRWRSDRLTWSAHRMTASGVSSRGFFIFSNNDLLWIGVESMRWTGPATNSSSRTFPRPASPAGFVLESSSHPPMYAYEGGFWAANFVDWQPAYRNHQMLVRLPWWSVWVATLILAATYYAWRRRVSRAPGGDQGRAVRRLRV